MRRYDVLSGILLILSIIDFALAAPVSRQKKLQARVEPGQVINVLENPASLGTVEEETKAVIDYFRNFGKTSHPSSAVHSSSSLSLPAPPRPNSITSNVVPKLKLPSFLGHGPSPLAKPETKLDSTGTGILSSPNTKQPASEPGGYEPNWPHDSSASESSGYESDRGFKTLGHPSNPSVSPWYDTESMSSDSELGSPKSPQSGSALRKDHGQASGYGPGTPPMEPHPMAHSTGSGGLTGPENQLSSTDSQSVVGKSSLGGTTSS